MKFQSHSDKMVVGICELVKFLVGPTLQMITDKLQIDSAISKQKSIQIFYNYQDFKITYEICTN